MKLDTADVLKVKRPLERAMKADDYMESARQMMAELSQIRSAALRESARTIGGAKTADLMGIARPNLYRAIRKDVSSAFVAEMGD